MPTIMNRRINLSIANTILAIAFCGLVGFSFLVTRTLDSAQKEENENEIISALLMDKIDRIRRSIAIQNDYLAEELTDINGDGYPDEITKSDDEDRFPSLEFDPMVTYFDLIDSRSVLTSSASFSHGAKLSSIDININMFPSFDSGSVFTSSRIYIRGKKGYIIQRPYFSNFTSADLSFSNLSFQKLLYANFTYADLSYTDLSFTNLLGADLTQANLSNANLLGVQNLTIEQLLTARSLYRCINLNNSLKDQLQKESDCLFTKEGCPPKIKRPPLH